jgi:hypothetical protein
LAVIANLLFVAYLLIPTGDADYRTIVAFFVTFFTGAALTLSIDAYSFVDTARRAQLDRLVRKFGINGFHVVCRYFDGDLELGVDKGWLARDGYALRFEGAASRFSITREMMVAEPEGRDIAVEVNGRPIRISVSAQRTNDTDVVDSIMRGWPSSEGLNLDRILPPSAPQARPWYWYLARALEKVSLAFKLSLPLVMITKGLFVPQSLTWLRWSLIFFPFVATLVAALILAHRLKRKDDALIAALPATSEPMVPLEAIGSEEARIVRNAF